MQEHGGCLLQASYSNYTRTVPAEVKSLLTIQHVVIKGDALTPLLLNFALEYAIRMIQVN